MADRTKYEKGDEWLRSDAQIHGRLTKSGHKKGILLKLRMPWNDDDDDPFEVKAVVEKVNADSLNQFCNMARGAYSARIDEQKAKKARAVFDKQMAADDAATTAPVVSGSKESIQISLIDSESVAAGVVASGARCVALLKELEIAQKENAMLLRVLEVLEDGKETDDAPSGNAETAESTARAEAQTETYKSLYWLQPTKAARGEEE